MDIQDGQYIIRQGDVGNEFYIIHVSPRTLLFAPLRLPRAPDSRHAVVSSFPTGWPSQVHAAEEERLEGDPPAVRSTFCNPRPSSCVSFASSLPRFDTRDSPRRANRNLSAGDYFGEMALMLDEPRHANVIAVGPCKCLSLDRSDFDELLGPLQDVISAQMRIRILRRYD